MAIEKIVHALCLGAALCSAQTIAISGTVRDRAGLTIAGATVTLENAALSTISGAGGEFTLSGVSTAITPRTTTHPSAALPIQIHQGSISLTLTESAPVKISVHDLKGRRLHTSAKSFSAGTHTLQLLLPSRGIYLYSVSIGPATYTFKSSPFGTTSPHPASSTHHASIAVVQQPLERTPITDVIAVKKQGYLDFRDSIKRADTSGVVLSLHPNAGDVMDVEGNVYQSVRIGNQVWTVQNWRSTKYFDGSDIPQFLDSAAWDTIHGPALCYPNNATEDELKKKWGALYNWYVVSPTNPKPFTPAGWRVPTDADWTALQDYLIANGYNADGTTGGNCIAKSLATQTDWPATSPAISAPAAHRYSPAHSEGKNNTSGFSALPAGCRMGNFSVNYGLYGGWWSTTTYTDLSDPWQRVYAGFCFIAYFESTFTMGHFRFNNALSVRFVRDIN